MFDTYFWSSVWSELLADGQAFYQAVHWNQTWLQILLACHVGLATLCFLVRHNETGLMALFFTLSVLILLASPLNALGQRYWPLFSTADYFQPHGHFLSLVYSLPLLALLFVVLLLLIIRVARTMVVVKRQQLRQQAQKRTTLTAAAPSEPVH
ncbi:hypothetical protein IWQ62_000069 [Dispira parvispora]|uniref:Transmembrane protein 18 n=1 Tax=Dispira parvispora TaxID=1520584 RepID=A0A9W8E9L3_9FUNG|nr:hypothetical protein IWQ62_000069 [Dispira parvispora]